MLTRVKAGPLTVRGVSVGGIYTSLHVPELSALFDVGIAARSAAAVNHIFISHGHVDHSGALSTLLGIRALVGKKTPPRVFMPEQMVDHMGAALEAMSNLQRWSLEIEAVPMRPGETATMGGDLAARALRCRHPVPCLGYQIIRSISKLRSEYRHLRGPEIAERRQAGEELLETVPRIELSYVTDSLVEVLDDEPSLFDSRVLILECTFFDERKPLSAARAGCHIHLDELLERAERFNNEVVVLMHCSQLYKPDQIAGILRDRCPESLLERLVPFVPRGGDWPG